MPPTFTSSSPLLPALVPILAVLVDLLAGDPPNLIHPVGWLGRCINIFRKTAGKVFRRKDRGTATRDAAAFLSGLVFELLGISLLGIGFWFVGRGVELLRLIPALLISALILKGSLAYRSLVRAARSVREALETGNLTEARRLLSWHLVSRPTDGLSEQGIASAAIESAAENFADSLVAPLFWYALAGLPGAWIYRFVDTADSILGYRDLEREWLGKAAARTDDIMCWLPARVTGWIISASAGLIGMNGKHAVHVMRRDARKSSSPNSGWPMAAAAGAMGLRLEKVNTYVLNGDARPPAASDIDAACRLLGWSLGLSVLIMASFSVIITAAFGLLLG